MRPNGIYFLYSNVIDNLSFPKDWEYNTEDNCWDDLSPAIKTIGLYTFEKVKQLNCHVNLEVIVNGKNEWYDFTWKL